VRGFPPGVAPHDRPARAIHRGAVAISCSARYHGAMPRTATFEVFRDSADEWRWRLVAANGNIIADSGEGYRSKQGATRGIESVKRSAPDAKVRVLDGS